MAASRRYFHGSNLDRAADRRGDDGWLRRQLDKADARILPVSGGRVGIRTDGAVSELAWLTREIIGSGVEYTAFLGLRREIPHFAASVNETEVETLCSRHRIELRGLRTVASLVDRESAGIGAYARALDLWQREHRYCGACGSPTRVDHGGFRRACEACGREHFPRIDPAIIVAVVHDHRCLLGRQARWPERRYSVLAGFVEPGETFEDAVAREVHEESGVRVVDIRYRGSQPWPFPSSLMVGFRARALGSGIRIGEELDDAFFISPRELEARVRAGDMILPPELSISRYLIDSWLAEEDAPESADWQPQTAWRDTS